jgi:hypothetical protein
MNGRYILVKGAVNPEHPDEIIPCWDERIDYVKRAYGKDYVINNQPVYLVDLVLDVQTKKLTKGIEINLYPEEEEFKAGDSVLVKTKRSLFDSNSLYMSTIKEVVYTDFEQSIVKGKKIEEYVISSIKKAYPDIVIDVATVYCIRHWQTYYLLEDDTLIKYSSELFRLIDKQDVLSRN